MEVRISDGGEDQMMGMTEQKGKAGVGEESASLGDSILDTG